MRDLLTRDEAVKKIKELIGQDLRPLADKFGVTVFKNGKLNKGWAGHVLERYLGWTLSSLQAPNGYNWELKVIPFKRNKKGEFVPKETMAITMINADNVANNSFENSHLLSKLKSMIICGRIFENKQEKTSKLLSVSTFDATDREIYNQVKSDYDLVRKVISEKGFLELSGRMGAHIQPRTKGPGHGSTSRAFYARIPFIKILLKL